MNGPTILLRVFTFHSYIRFLYSSSLLAFSPARTELRLVSTLEIYAARSSANDRACVARTMRDGRNDRNCASDDRFIIGSSGIDVYARYKV